MRYFTVEIQHPKFENPLFEYIQISTADKQALGCNKILIFFKSVRLMVKFLTSYKNDPFSGDKIKNMINLN